MSSSPYNPSPELTSKELTKEISDPASASSLQISPGSTTPPGHEALQALLAFSSLHDQIRQRRARDSRAGDSDPADVWGLEQFVLDEVLQLVAERALTITGADGVAIALAEQDAIVCRASAGIIAPDSGVRLDPSSGFSGACLRTGRIVRCDDTESDPRVNVQACRRLGARSLVAVPISGMQGVVGLLEAFASETWGFNDSDVRSLNLLAELILAAMKPEEDRLAEVSQRVVAGPPATTESQPPLLDATREGEEAESATQPGSESSEKETEPEATELRDLLSGLQPGVPAGNSRPGLAVVLVLVLVAMGLGAGMWWKVRQRNRIPVNPPQAVVASPALEAETSAAAHEEAKTPDASLLVPGEPRLSPVNREKLSVLPKVTGIRHESSADSSTVIVDLQDQVQYEAHRLSDPERIYFDLHDTALAAGLFLKTIEVGDKLLAGIRIAQPVPGVTRVVLETRDAPDFSVRLESNPSRLVVEIRRAEAAQPKAKAESLKIEPPAPLPSAVASPAQSASQENGPVRSHPPRFRIALDAGHGGWDLGTVGRKGLLEKNLVLDIVDRLGKLVQKGLGAEVVYTRASDAYVALEKRAEIANLSHADLFVSVHANYSSDSSARGVETYYTNTYSSVRARTREWDESGAALENINWTNVDIREKVRESRRFAATVQRSLYGALASENPGVRNRGVKEATYVVLTGTTMPAILAEVSFVSSPEDANKLESSAYRQQIADALYEGIAHYAATFHPVTVASASGKPGGK